jgi:hypothetical protein
VGVHLLGRDPFERSEGEDGLAADALKYGKTLDT